MGNTCCNNSPNHEITIENVEKSKTPIVKIEEKKDDNQIIMVKSSDNLGGPQEDAIKLKKTASLDPDALEINKNTAEVAEDKNEKPLKKIRKMPSGTDENLKIKKNTIKVKNILRNNV